MFTAVKINELEFSYIYQHRKILMMMFRETEQVWEVCVECVYHLCNFF